MAFLSLTRGNTHVLNQNDFNEGYGVEPPFSYSTTRSTWARISLQRRLPAQARDAEPCLCQFVSPLVSPFPNGVKPFLSIAI